MTLKTTPLNAAHRAMGAKMVDFGGWDMPVNYGSQIDEHHRGRNDCGMFDVSHMRVVDIKGKGVRDFLRYLLANNVDKLTTPGKALYSCMLLENGGVIDDLIVYFFTPERYRIVVNAGTAAKDIAWMRGQLTEFSAELIVRRRDNDDAVAIIAAQGPDAKERRLTGTDAVAMIAVQGPQARERFWTAFPASRAATQVVRKAGETECPTGHQHATDADCHTVACVHVQAWLRTIVLGEDINERDWRRRELELLWQRFP